LYTVAYECPVHSQSVANVDEKEERVIRHAVFLVAGDGLQHNLKVGAKRDSRESRMVD